jgi:hypothetical protein
MRLIKAKEDHKFVQYFGENYTQDDSLVANLVVLVHHVAYAASLEAREARSYRPERQQEVALWSVAEK